MLRYEELYCPEGHLYWAGYSSRWIEHAHINKCEMHGRKIQTAHLGQDSNK